eukprot:TRINITY_DN5835_c0_g1_i2.p1 TRINITY_DN5835_c0_g1~~TRINITY_DN5835_c0_g1_i2.p1  ORF type:complete len:93 (-),score=11.39 TRINITY_DN5835_c0_g1_i2:158-436(-)
MLVMIFTACVLSFVQSAYEGDPVTATCSYWDLPAALLSNTTGGSHEDLVVKSVDGNVDGVPAEDAILLIEGCFEMSAGVVSECILVLCTHPA